MIYLDGTLQEGIYHSPGTRPGKFFCIMFLRVRRGFENKVKDCLLSLWEMYQNLKFGIERDLPHNSVNSGMLTVLIGYGQKVFQLPDVKQSCPDALTNFGSFLSPHPTGGGPLLRNSGLSYASDIRNNLATEEIVFQFIAETQLAVNRAVVETWKILFDTRDKTEDAAPLLMTTFYNGFQRDDHRSWIGFHDGVSNIKSQDRLGAIKIDPTSQSEEKWTVGGTYMTYMRLGIDLLSWRKITKTQQDLLVGREKYSGCPIVNIDENGIPIIQSGCPVENTHEITQPGNETYHESTTFVDERIRQSHIHRANRHSGSPSSANSLRIFRQGYEFLESIEESPGFRAGLNFVSFQDTPQRLYRILTQDGWLGGTNFGGDPKNQLPGIEKLISVRAAGNFLIPPLNEGEIFPGSSIFFNT